ncbi:MAG: molybdenum cofactor biosynthesis protein MoaE [Acidobacteria bacterium]|nr:molybdenum cofactor biosynthesis protein MoaE [Acidobacteriota bacterium]
MCASPILAAFTREPIDEGPLLSFLGDPGSGARVTFTGTVRDTSRGRRVTRLEYEAYEEMALPALRTLLEEAAGRWGLRRAAVVHRLGPAAPGETSVWIGVASPHRAAAFEACRHLIDAIKAAVPIWKKECYDDGYSCVEGEEAPFQRGGDHRQ